MKELALTSLLRALTLKRLSNIAAATLAYALSKWLRRPIVLGKPFILTVEPSSLCNLRCPQCATGAGRLTRNVGLLKRAHFERLLEEIGDDVMVLLLFNQGEPFLHPELMDFIEIARRKKIYVSLSTNGHFFSADTAQRLIEVEPDMIIISLDGADRATYEKYRCGGDFNEVVHGIGRLVAAKKASGKRSPEIAIQFLVLKHNASQIEQVRKLAKSFGIQRLLLKTAQVEDAAAASVFLPETDAYCRYHIENGRLTPKANLNKSCSRLWTSAVVLSDGAIVPCCFDKKGEYVFGHLSAATSFTHIWRSSGYRQFREENLHRRKSIEICTNCTQGLDIYR